MTQALAEKLVPTGPAEKKRSLQRHKVSSWQDGRAAFAKEKRNSAINSDHQIVRRKKSEDER